MTTTPRPNALTDTVRLDKVTEADRAAFLAIFDDVADTEPTDLDENVYSQLRD